MADIKNNKKTVDCERILSYVDKEGKPLNFYYKQGFKVSCNQIL